jgi:hypothetical protein
MPLAGTDLVAYVNLGSHRSGTQGDADTSRWIEARLQSLGFVTEQQAFGFTRFDGSTVSSGVWNKSCPECGVARAGSESARARTFAAGMHGIGASRRRA